MNRAADRLELVVDPVRRTGRTLLSAGVEQSYVDVEDPRHLHFEYVRRITSAVQAAAPAGAPLSVLHLGGGALTLPRWLAATRPGSPQRVVERDAAVVELVARELPPLPPEVRVEVADARDALTDTPDGQYDLVIADIYRAAQMPRHVRTVEFAAEVARVLGPGGTYLVNVTDLPPLVGTRAQVATLRAVFADVCVIGDRRMLRGRRYGNLVLAATSRPDGLPVARLAVAALRDPVPGGLLHATALDLFVACARPVTDADDGR
ncbi:fused MFS/spermidine synthase [Micromonospora sp. WMMD961]|uniref:spermidine synthase n=1 Tax=Micromonospora sp. WMMD961 TaxID=3016100 RepID=UPI002416B7C7|nr:fused MFS/spermidine synthase [Micromonospora sp. WMMD961]MDG4781134.1 fused MFS/spermidine synthase [Micromonospora sp. WMMD961]